VVGTRSDLLIADPHQRLQLGGTGPAAAGAAEKARIYGAALRRYVLALHRAGVPVLVVDPVPRIPVPHGDLSGCAVVLVLAERCSGSVSLARVRSQLRVARAADREAVRGIADAHVADFTRLLCAADVCASDRGKLAVYRDTSHLSVAGALTLTDRFAALIRADAR
jgi:hypothetical protein